MTQARRQLVDPNHAQMFHCTARCVRRAWLFGIDKYTNLSFEHRKYWVEDRILKLADVFACGIYAFAIMSNHYHMVLHMHPATASSWTDSEVAQRWTRLYPAATAAETALKIEAIVANLELVKIYRTRLSDLSWLMKSVSEHIARRANAEDKVSGRFWEGRFKCQLITSEKAMLAALTYVDLNPIRAKVAKNITKSFHTGVRLRTKRLAKDPGLANEIMRPLAGVVSQNIPKITEADYIELVDATGRGWHLGKRGKIDATEPKALSKLGLSPNHWTRRVKGVGSGYWRVVGELEDLVERAKQLGLRTLYGTGFARILKGL
jgi:REP element-mobilizing transposase RayT